MEHFGPGIDLLDINTDGENVVNFTCFTEKQVSVNNEGEFGSDCSNDDQVGP